MVSSFFNKHEFSGIEKWRPNPHQAVAEMKLHKPQTNVMQIYVSPDSLVLILF